MTAPAQPTTSVLHRSTERLFREHIAAMHVYAFELEAVLGAESPIAKRIHSCAASNARILDALRDRKKKGRAA